CWTEVHSTDGVRMSIQAKTMTISKHKNESHKMKFADRTSFEPRRPRFSSCERLRPKGNTRGRARPHEPRRPRSSVCVAKGLVQPRLQGGWRSVERAFYRVLNLSV